MKRPTKRSLGLASIVAALWCCAFPDSTSGALVVVVPYGLSAREGSGASGILYGAAREQTVYAATNFPKGTITISELDFRPNVIDFLPGSPFTGSVLYLQVTLSTTPRNPGELSADFADNSGTDAVLAVNGPVTLSSAFAGPAQGPKSFDIVVPLSRPFTYNPAAGNLLVDIENFSGEAAIAIDAEISTVGAASRVASSLPISTSGTPDNDADVLQIDYSPFIITNPPPTGPPVMVLQPAAQTADIGLSAFFIANATGAPPLSYQWVFNGTNVLAGATNNSLAIVVRGFDQAGAYSVQVSNALGTTNSIPAALTVDIPPIPTNGYVAAILRSECSSAPSPPPPVGQIATGPDYVIMNLGLGNVSDYARADQLAADAVYDLLMPIYCSLPTIGEGCVNTENIEWGLEIYDANGNPRALTGSPGGGGGFHSCGCCVLPTCTPVPGKAVAWWRGESNAMDSIGNNNGTLINGVRFAPGEVGTAFSFDGTGYIIVSNASDLNLTSGLTIETWVNLSGYSTNSWVSIAGKDCPGCYAQYDLGITNIGGQWKFSASLGHGDSYSSATGFTAVQTNTWYHAAMTFDGSTLTLYVNGSYESSITTTSPPATTQPFVIGGQSSGAGGWDGLIDEVTVYNRWLGYLEVHNVYLAGNLGKCPPEWSPFVPLILSQPTNETAYAGQAAIFGVVAYSRSPASYQWTFNGTNIIGGTNNQLVLADLQTNQAGTYAVQITSADGTANSLPATLTVNPYVTNGFVVAIIRSGDLPDSPPPLGTIKVGPSYVLMTVGLGDPTNYARAQQLVPDAVFEQLMPLFCALQTNSCDCGAEWEVGTYNANGTANSWGPKGGDGTPHPCPPKSRTQLSFPPELKIAPAQSSVGLSWSTTAAGFDLEASSNLVDWYPAAPTLLINGGTVSGQMPPTGTRLFYRLHQN